MSNNDLYCSVCQSNHHPMDCPLDEDNPRSEMTELERVVVELVKRDNEIARKDKHIAELEAENNRMRLAFQNYGRHINDERMMCATYRDSRNDCDCGYDSTEQVTEDKGE